jgi:hypothetical protein
METLIEHHNKHYMVDTTNNQITFLDQRYYRTEEGAYIPSATTILECYPKGAQYYEWLKKNGEDSDNIRDEAGRRGSRVHQMTENYDNGEEVSLINPNGDINMKVSEWAMFERYVEFRTRFDMEILQNEFQLISPKLGFAGTLDRVVKLDGKTILLDIKTSNAVYDSYWLQLASYKELLKEQGTIVDDVGILWLNAKTRTEGKKGDYQGRGWQLVLHGGDTSKEWELFKATKTLWAASNGEMKPREMSYKLSHKR